MPDVAQTEAAQIRQMEPAKARDVSDGVAAGVAVAASIGHFSDADAVEHDPNHAPEHNSDCSTGVPEVRQQIVEVSSGAPPLIDMTGTTIAQNITSQEFDRLPKGRSFQDLAVISPSVNRGEIEGFQVNGASGAENQFNVDGISTTSVINGVSRQNAMFEILNEVQVKTSGIEAEYGGALGGVINASTKSGGNAFHGDLHYYFLGNAIAAGPVQRLLLDPATESTAMFVQDHKNEKNQHELGGYLLRDRLYFFSALSPTWTRRSNEYLFSNGTEPGTLNNRSLSMQAFNKISWDATRPA